MTVFPNLHPWGGYNQITYRFRPNGDDHRSCIMEVYLLSPFKGDRPPPAEHVHLEADQPWRTAVEQLGSLARVFDQDEFNLEAVQKGLRRPASRASRSASTRRARSGTSTRCSTAGSRTELRGGTTRTGSSMMPRSTKLRVCRTADGSTTSTRSKRWASSCSTSAPSIRASAAPRQVWMPCPKARCWRTSRSGENVSGSSNTASSRFAEAKETKTVAPSASATPPSRCRG